MPVKRARARCRKQFAGLSEGDSIILIVAEKTMGTTMLLRGFFSALVALAVLVQPTSADETCMSPYMAKIVGQEDYVYIWTLGLEGVGDGEDKLVTVDVNPTRKTTRRSSILFRWWSTRGASGLTDDRRYLWASGLDASKIFIFDVHTDPAAPVRTIDDFVEKTGGVVGPTNLSARSHAHYRPVEQS